MKEYRPHKRTPKPSQEDLQETKVSYSLSGKRIVENRRRSVKDRGPIATILSNRIVLAVLAVIFVVGVLAASDAYENPDFAKVLNLELGYDETPIDFDKYAAEDENFTVTEKTIKEDSKKINVKGETKWDHYRHVAKNALDYYNLDKAWTNVILAMIRVESNGNENIDNQSDIMQTAEGDGKGVLYNGVPGKGVRAGTPEASIYAGVLEFSHCIGDFEKYLGRTPSPTDENDIALLTQGYNYGHQGWFSWLKNNGITTWDLDNSQMYQNRIDGLGTANHGKKCKAAYEDFVEEYGEKA